MAQREVVQLDRGRIAELTEREEKRLNERTQASRALFERGRGLGCSEAWVLADQSNGMAQRLYESAGGKAAPEPAIMFEFPLL